jgi:hypothetical protein
MSSIFIVWKSFVLYRELTKLWDCSRETFTVSTVTLSVTFILSNCNAALLPGVPRATMRAGLYIEGQAIARFLPT